MAFIFGTSGNDSLTGTSGNDTLVGNDGNDTLTGGGGLDVLYGGNGNDTYVISSKDFDIYDSGGTDTARIGADFVKIPSSIENVIYTGGAQALPYWIDDLLSDDAAGGAYGRLLGSGKTFGFAFPSSLPSYNNDAADADGFSAFNAAQRSFARQALNYISTVVGVKFVEVTEPAAKNTIVFANNLQDGSAGYAYYPSGSFFGSDVFLAKNVAGNLAPKDGTFSALTLIHELGHTLGLEHPFNGDAPFLTGSEDATKWTVMSYNYNSQQFHLNYSPLDIAALQYLYGPSTTARTGNDRYVVDATTSNFVWDGAGTDTLDASAQTQAVTLYLDAGYWGFVGSKASQITAAGQVTVNFGSVIENLFGGAGNDALYGSALGNTIKGNDGNDTLTGNAGNDRLEGGAGNDSLNGGTGADTMVGGTGDDQYIIDNSGDVIGESASSGTDTVTSRISYTLGSNLENLRLSAAGAINGTGNSLNNLLFAADGDNVLNGAGGFDTVSYLYSHAAVTANLSTGVATGGSGNDSLLNIEHLTGSNYADSLTGNSKDNVLAGGSGNDSLMGSSGSDTLDGGKGNDYLKGSTGADMLTGGSGADTFDFDALAEMGLTSTTWDRISDFKGSDGDRIDLSTLDANTTLSGNQAFVFVGSSSFTVSGQLRYDAAAGMLYGSVDADTDAEFAIELVGNPAFVVDYLLA